MIERIKKFIKGKTPRLYKCIIMTLVMKEPYYRLIHFYKIQRIKRKKKATVVFFVSSLGMWRYEAVFTLMSKDNRINTYLVIQPFSTYTEESQHAEVTRIKKYFDQRNIKYRDMTENPEEKVQWFRKLDVDIIFYPQPYYGMYANKLDPKYNRNKLFCYCPYGIVTIDTPSLYNEAFQNISWKLFYPTRYHLLDANKHAFNKGRNVIVTGDLNGEKFLDSTLNNPWKNSKSNRKKIIWAPHFTILGNAILSRGSFLWLSDFMKDFAIKYKDIVQIAFKPHPRLKTELYEHPLWGKTKTDQYYEFWSTIENGQLEEGDYWGLFYYSDAMIHDCGSFSAEYLYVNKPCIFTTKDVDSTISDLNTFGKECINLHYIGDSIETVDKLLKDIILYDKDPYKNKRSKFIEDILLPHKDISCSTVIYNNILAGLGFKSLQFYTHE